MENEYVNGETNNSWNESRISNIAIAKYMRIVYIEFMKQWHKDVAPPTMQNKRDISDVENKDKSQN